MEVLRECEWDWPEIVRSSLSRIYVSNFWGRGEEEVLFWGGTINITIFSTIFSLSGKTSRIILAICRTTPPTILSCSFFSSCLIPNSTFFYCSFSSLFLLRSFIWLVCSWISSILDVSCDSRLYILVWSMDNLVYFWVSVSTKEFWCLERESNNVSNRFSKENSGLFVGDDEEELFLGICS